MRVGEVCSRGGKVPLAKRVGRCMFEVANLLCLFRACMSYRVVTKISSCWVNTTSRRGIKWPGISFGSIFLLFSDKSRRGPLS